jgi:large subunit ribosomal protein L15
MKFNDLNLSKNRAPKRVGRGISAGQGKTAGRGTKGQGARKSGGVRPGFEGGQTPLYLKLPKLRGFRSIRPKAELVYTGQLDTLTTKTIDTTSLAEAGIVSSPYVNVKLILKGEVTKAVTVHVQGASQGAEDALKKAGGTFKKVPRLARTSKKAEA